MDPMRDLDTLRGMGGAPFVLALTEVIKRMFPELPSRWIPLVAIFWGMILNVSCAWYYGDPLFPSVWIGTASGLIAVGSYSAVKALGRSASAAKPASERATSSANEPGRATPT
jgi:hypothetical protein